MPALVLGLFHQRFLTWTYSSGCPWLGSVSKEVADLGLVPQTLLTQVCSCRSHLLWPAPTEVTGLGAWTHRGHSIFFSICPYAPIVSTHTHNLMEQITFYS